MKVRIRQRIPKYSDRAIDIIQWFESEYLKGDTGTSINLYLKWTNLEEEHDSNCYEARTKHRYTVVVAVRSHGVEYTFVRNLLHELWHLKQMREGRLAFNSRHTRFDGRNYPVDMDYAEMPWEIEAYGMEQRLVDEYLDDRHIRSEIMTPIVTKVII